MHAPSIFALSSYHSTVRSNSLHLGGGRALDRRSLHPPPLEIIVVLNNISSWQPSVTKITIPRYTPHRYVIHRKSSQSMNFLSSIHVRVSVRVTQSPQMPEGGWFQTLLPWPIIVPPPTCYGLYDDRPAASQAELTGPSRPWQEARNYSIFLHPQPADESHGFACPSGKFATQGS